MNLVPMTEDHIEEAQALTTSFNWPHTVEDWSFAFGEGVGYAAIEQGNLMGTCLTWSLGSGVSTLGLLAVSKSAQGRGLGRLLLRRALQDLADKTVLLHATEQAVDLYVAEGFAPLGEVRQIQGIVLDAPSSKSQGPASTMEMMGANVPPTVKQRIYAQDLGACGIDRSKLLDALMMHSQVTLLGPPEASTGFAFTRAFGRGVVIGPVVASSEKDACLLVGAILDAHLNSFVRIDLTAELASTLWLAERGLPEVDRVLAMSNAPLPPPKGEERRFALIGHAFG